VFGRRRRHLVVIGGGQRAAARLLGKAGADPRILRHPRIAEALDPERTEIADRRNELLGLRLDPLGAALDVVHRQPALEGRQVEAEILVLLHQPGGGQILPDRHAAADRNGLRHAHLQRVMPFAVDFRKQAHRDLHGVPPKSNRLHLSFVLPCVGLARRLQSFFSLLADKSSTAYRALEPRGGMNWIFRDASRSSPAAAPALARPPHDCSPQAAPASACSISVPIASPPSRPRAPQPAVGRSRCPPPRSPMKRRCAPRSTPCCSRPAGSTSSSPMPASMASGPPSTTSRRPNGTRPSPSICAAPTSRCI